MKAIKAVYYLLSQSESITASIYPQRIPEGSSLPAIALSQISRISNDTKKEYSKSDESRVQITIVSETATAAYDLADSVRSAMRAEVPNSYNTVLVQNISFDNEITDQDDDADEQGLFMVVQDYLIMYSTVGVSLGSLLKEDGSFLLLESGDQISL